jgi:hypothetical protein
MDFFQKPVQKAKEDCKIKIKNTKGGKQIEFSGNCSKEQLQMAKMNLESGELSEDEF